MPNQTHWTANSPHAKAPAKHNTTVELDTEDQPIPLTDPCDGGEAGDLFRLHGNAAVGPICERVAKNGWRTK